MLIGCVLLAVAALVVVAAAVCWLAGVQLVALMKLALAVCAVLLTVAGVIVVGSDLLQSAGYLLPIDDAVHLLAKRLVLQPE